jgi:hypothetical protein
MNLSVCLASQAAPRRTGQVSCSDRLYPQRSGKALASRARAHFGLGPGAETMRPCLRQARRVTRTAYGTRRDGNPAYAADELREMY